jgi:GT2 family glycosyltransferase
MKSVYFIAVNFNNSDFTIDYVDSVKDLTSIEDNINVIIVDNNSEESDFNKLEAKLKDVESVKLIRSESNLGYFGGLNVGIDSIPDVSEENENLLVIGNNDLLFRKDFLIELSKINYDDNTFVLAPNIITIDGYHQNPQLVTKQSEFKKFILRLYFLNYCLARILRYAALAINKIKGRNDNMNSDKKMFIRQGNGACFILTNNFFKFYEKLDDSVFLWGEECLLANQLSSVGGKMLYEPSIIVYHQTTLEDTLFRGCNSKEKHKISKASYKIYSKYV